MKSSLNKFWNGISTRRFVSLLIGAIWISTALQPCVMASVAESDLRDFTVHHYSAVSNSQNDVVHCGCPHCKTATPSHKDCDPQHGVNCDSDETLVYFERLKPAETELFDGQPKFSALVSSRNFDTRVYSAPVSMISRSLELPAGPPLIDLYQAYLK